LGANNTPKQDQAWLEKLERALDLLLDDPPAYLAGELAALIELRAGIRARRSGSDSEAV
jgi:hypothetical protein